MQGLVQRDQEWNNPVQFNNGLRTGTLENDKVACLRGKLLLEKSYALRGEKLLTEPPIFASNKGLY